MDIKEALHNILEFNHQMTGSMGQCPWCQAEEFPIDEKGNEILSDFEEAHGFDIEHEDNCAVTLIEDLLMEYFPNKKDKT